MIWFLVIAFSGPSVNHYEASDSASVHQMPSKSACLFMRKEVKELAPRNYVKCVGVHKPAN